MKRQPIRPQAGGTPILITGSHRSGTTWVGRMLAAAPATAYIHEPFSVTDAPGPGICNVRFGTWFTYINSANETAFLKPLRHMLELKYDLRAAILASRSRKQVRASLSEYGHFERYRRQGFRPLVKDPMAFFSAGWLAERFGGQVVVVIRHPAAFVSSILKLRWRHPFVDFLCQELLMKEVLYPFAAQIELYARREQEIIDQAILLWRMIYDTAQRYRQAHPDWIFIRHEDLSREPLSRFGDLYRRLGLDFDTAVAQRIDEYSRSTNPHDPNAPVGSEQTLRRNSQRNIYNWRQRLAPCDIVTIRREVEAIADHFYTDADW